MRKLLTALAAATIAVAAVATPTTADARWRGGWWGPALGGFAVGALIGSAFARPYYAYPYYGYGYGYRCIIRLTATAIRRTTATDRGGRDALPQNRRAGPLRKEIEKLCFRNWLRVLGQTWERVHTP